MTTVWVFIPRYWVDEEEIVGHEEVFDTKEHAEQYLAYALGEELEQMVFHDNSSESRETIQRLYFDAKNTVHGNLAAWNDLVHELKSEDIGATQLYYMMVQSSISPRVVNQSLLRFTEPKPEREYDFDDFVLGMGEIKNEMDLYGAQLGHPDQEIATSEMKIAMTDHIQSLESMLTYQQYLIKIGTAEEMEQFNVQGMLQIAKALMKDIELNLKN